MTIPKILFILKKRQTYQATNYPTTMHSGLYNSASFVNEMLNESGFESHLVEVIDNNCIDKEVTKYKPTHVIIEAIWVVPDKFEVLKKLHPDVKWIIRIHSEIPFIANEGNAINWLFKYSNISNVYISPNSPKMYKDLKAIGINNLIYLPNYYPVGVKEPVEDLDDNYINIGCFGSVRPMKNQLIQAVAAIKFGNDIGVPIKFNINSERIEHGDSALKNIRALFENQPVHQLIEHPWYSHDEFLKVVKTMDMGLQVSLNETFNIVSADFVSQGIPLIGSKEIFWLNCLYKANPTSVNSIVRRMKLAYALESLKIHNLNRRNLISYSMLTKQTWIKYLSIND